MSLELYGTHLDGLALTDQEKIQLIETMKVIIENIINNSFMRTDINDENQ
ncbi:TPA: hypothetical protein KKW55_001715 [Legionella pneumophila]|nr:hypothetical protein [Legionella pneumophila]HAV0409879.1 hypothetical protein [Legionella pneumophila]HBD7062143.1 hypothetical protein [Legionella pneumophila]HBD7430248.1 hypothetical protein [Legionella pneumophila]HBD7473513.1 hypothetical protein [Legionella pneumophila]